MAVSHSPLLHLSFSPACYLSTTFPSIYHSITLSFSCSTPPLPPLRHSTSLSVCHYAAPHPTPLSFTCSYHSTFPFLRSTQSLHPFNSLSLSSSSSSSSSSTPYHPISLSAHGLLLRTSAWPCNHKCHLKRKYSINVKNYKFNFNGSQLAGTGLLATLFSLSGGLAVARIPFP